MTTKLNIKRTFLASLLAGAGAAIANNAWHLGYSAITGVAVPGEINLGSVTGGSIVSLIIAGLGFFVAQRYIKNGRTVYMVAALVLSILSCIGLFGPTLPDGTAVPQGWLGLTLPLHVIGGLATLILPRIADRMKA